MYPVAVGIRWIQFEGACWEIPWFVFEKSTSGDGVGVGEDDGAEFFAGCD
jgi:hypothetical protein